jgi:pimeloyl-ACP methyl ester carboxylesterase
MTSRPAVGTFVDVSAGAIHVRRDGPAGAPVVVLLHGFASSLHAFDRMTPLLAGECQVLRIDLLGHGCSPRDAASYHSESQAAMVAEVLDRLSLRDATVVGHSFGADVAIALAERADRVRRVVVVAQAPDYSVAQIPRGNSLLSRPGVVRLLQRGAPSWTVARASGFAFAPGVRTAGLFDRADRLRADFRAMAPAMGQAVLIDRPRRLAQRGLDQRLLDLGRPALVILGARDRLYPVRPTRERYLAVPGVRVEVLAGSGHSPPLEQPAEVSRLIAAFAQDR